MSILEGRVHRVAAAGGLQAAERRTVDMIHAAGTGVALTLVAVPASERDLGLADSVYQAVKSAITDVPVIPGGDGGTGAVVLRARISDVTVLSAAERDLLTGWLDRILDG